jgi:hypothetical protein
MKSKKSTFDLEYYKKGFEKDYKLMVSLNNFRWMKLHQLT